MLSITRVGLLIATALIVSGLGTLAASAPAGPKEVRYFYGDLQNRRMGDVRFMVSDGVASDIVIRAHGRCEHEGEKVRPYFGSREASGLNDAELNPNGGFRERQHVKTALDLPYIREITGKVGEDGAEATARIQWDSPLTRPTSRRTAHCDTGNRFAALDEISASEYSGIVAKSPIG